MCLTDHWLQCAVPPRYRSGPPLQCAVPPRYRSGPLPGRPTLATLESTAFLALGFGAVNGQDFRTRRVPLGRFTLFLITQLVSGSRVSLTQGCAGPAGVETAFVALWLKFSVQTHLIDGQEVQGTLLKRRDFLNSFVGTPLSCLVACVCTSQSLSGIPRYCNFFDLLVGSSLSGVLCLAWIAIQVVFLIDCLWLLRLFVVAMLGKEASCLVAQAIYVGPS